jgi:hypothetical protein
MGGYYFQGGQQDEPGMTLDDPVLAAALAAIGPAPARPAPAPYDPNYDPILEARRAAARATPEAPYFGVFDPTAPLTESRLAREAASVQPAGPVVAPTPAPTVAEPLPASGPEPNYGINNSIEYQPPQTLPNSPMPPTIPEGYRGIGEVGRTAIPEGFGEEPVSAAPSFGEPPSGWQSAMARGEEWLDAHRGEIPSSDPSVRLSAQGPPPLPEPAMVAQGAANDINAIVPGSERTYRNVPGASPSQGELLGNLQAQGIEAAREKAANEVALAKTGPFGASDRAHQMKLEEIRAAGGVDLQQEQMKGYVDVQVANIQAAAHVMAAQAAGETRFDPKEKYQLDRMRTLDAESAEDAKKVSDVILEGRRRGKSDPEINAMVDQATKRLLLERAVRKGDLETVRKIMYPTNPFAASLADEMPRQAPAPNLP